MLARVVMSARQMGQTVQNTIHLYAPGGSWATDGAALPAKIRDNWLYSAGGIASQQMADVVWNQVQVYDADNPGTAPFTLTVSIAGTDSNGTTQIMPYASYILRIRALTGGKHGRGRIYIPGPRFGHFINGQLSAAAITATNTVVSNLTTRWIGGSSTQGWELAICPRGGGTADKILADFIQYAPTSGVQRRRNIGVGI